MISVSARLVEKVRKVLDYEATDNDPHNDATLTEIMHLVDMHYGVTSEGWNPETARLFAIDTAMTAIRRNLNSLPDTERHDLLSRLQETRTLVVAGRDDELGFIQAALETQLSIIPPGWRRRMWLTAIDALIPSPYRAALVSTKNALTLVSVEAFAEISDLLRNRLLARLGEGSLLSEPPNPLHLTA